MFDLAADTIGNDSNLPVLITGASILLAAVATGVWGYINQRRGGSDRRMPTVPEIWERMDKVETKLETERNARIGLEDRVRDLRTAFVQYVDRVRRGGPYELTHDERAMLEDTQERSMITDKTQADRSGH